VCKISTVGNDADSFLLDYCKRVNIRVASTAKDRGAVS
jgi:hypothetical protein